MISFFAVASFVDAWIEIKTVSYIDLDVEVASFVDAWIEICMVLPIQRLY